MKEYLIEYFLINTNIDKEAHFLIRPLSLDKHNLKDIIKTTKKREFNEEDIKNIEKVDANLRFNNLNPDPTVIKELSSWYHAQLSKGAILYRYGFDGRKIGKKNKPLATVEGMYIDGIDIERTIDKYKEKDIDILATLEDHMPDDIERYLIAYNSNIFVPLKKKCLDEKKSN